MKKVLVVLLSLCMVLGCFSFAAAGSFTDVAADDANLTAIEVLSGLSILQGDGNGTFRPADGLKRVEACVIIDKIMGYGELAKVQAATSFSDVPASYWGSGYIAVAANLGLIEGYGDGKFGPEDKLTYDQWLTIVVRALGYADDTLAGTWPQNFQVKALNLGLVDTKKVGSADATRSDVASVTFEALSADRVEYDAKGNVKSLPTFLADKNCLNVSVSKGYNADNAYGTCYKNAKGKILAFVPATTTLTGKFASDKFVLADGTKYTVSNKLAAKYYDNGVVNASATDLVDGKTYTLEVAFDKEDATKIASIYSASVWTPTKTVQILKADVTANAKALKALKATDTAVSVKLGGETVTIACTKGVPAVDVSALAEDDVVTYYVNGSLKKIEVSNATVEGYVTKIATVSGVKYYTIDGSAYALTAKPTNPVTYYLADASLNIQTSTTYTYYLDAAGKLFKAVAVKGVDPTVYGFVTEGAVKANAATSYVAATPAMVKLLTADGEDAVYKVNATANKTIKLQASGTNLEKGDLVKFALNEDGEIISLTELTKEDANGKSYSVANGILGGKLLASDVVVVYKTTTGYAVGTKAVIPATLGANDEYYVGSVSGKVEFVYVEKTATTEVKNTVLFLSVNGQEYDAVKKAPVYTATAYLDGEEVVLKKVDTFGNVALDGQLYTATVVDGYVSNVAPAATPTDLATATDIEGNNVEVNGSYVNVASDALVYVALYEDATSTTKITGFDVVALEDVDLEATPFVEFYALNKGTNTWNYNVAIFYAVKAVK